jgi:hypothetical protein
MDDEVRLGYQAAVVSVGSPTYGRLWLAVKPHPGNLVSCLLAEELVLAAEASTGVRPWRRTELLHQQWQALCDERRQAEQRLARRQAGLAAVQAELQMRTDRLQTAAATFAAVVLPTSTGRGRSAHTVGLPRPGSRSRRGSGSTPTRRRWWRAQPSRSPATRRRSSWRRRRKASYLPVCSISSTRMPPIGACSRRFSPKCWFRDRCQRRPADRNGLRSLHQAP